MSTNTLPFLSLECGMVVDKKNEGLELKSSTTMMEAAALLKSSSTSVGIGWCFFFFLHHFREKTSLD